MHSNDLVTAMKLGMRRLASGIGVLATETADGGRFAMTVSSVTSVSDDPPSLLVCVNKQISGQGNLVDAGNRFAISILSAGQEEVSNRCAGRSGDVDRFTVGDWAPGYENLPYLRDAQATFFCTLDQVVDYGSHHILVARIEAVEIPQLVVDPLIYVDGGYATLQRSQ